MPTIRSPLTLQASDQPRTGRRAALDLLRPYQRAALEDARKARPMAPIGGYSVAWPCHPLTPAAHKPAPALTREAEDVLTHYHAPEALRTGDRRALLVIHGCKLVCASLAAVELQAAVRVLWAAWKVGAPDVVARAEVALVERVIEHRARVGGDK